MFPEVSQTAREESRNTAAVPSLRRSLTSRVRTPPRSSTARPSTGCPASKFKDSGSTASSSRFSVYPSRFTKDGFASSKCPSGELKYTPSCRVSNNSVKRISFSRCSVTSRPSVEIQGFRFHRQQFPLLRVSQQVHQRRIRVQQVSLRRAEVHAFLQGLEQFGKAHLLLALFGDVAPQHARAYDLIAFNNAIQDAFKIKWARTILEPDPHRTRPPLLFQKAPQAALYLFPGWFLNQVVDLASNQFRIRQSGQLRNALVDRPQRAVERHRARRIIKGVDQLLEVALRAHDDLAELVELLFRRRCPHMFLQSVQQLFQFANFASPPVGIHREQNGKS